MARNQEVIENLPLNDDEAYYKNLFEQCDTNNDGKICYDELENYINGHYSECKRLRGPIILKIHRAADKNGDDELDYNEFVDLVTHPKFKDFVDYHINEYVNFLIPAPIESPPPSDDFPLRTRRAVGSHAKSIQYHRSYSCYPPAVFLVLITAIQIACYFADKTGGEILLYDPLKRNECWRFITYIFVHTSVHHLLVNMLVQILLGIPLELVHKWWRLLIIYLTGAIGGSMLHSIGERGSRLAGASGSVYAIMTAQVANVIINWGQMQYPFVQLIIFGILAFYDLSYSIVEYYIMDIPTNVSILAHLGGAVSGILVGIYTLRNMHVVTFEKYLWWISLIVYILFIVVVIIVHIFVL